MFTFDERPSDVAVQQQSLEARYRTAMEALSRNRACPSAWVELGEVALSGDNPASLFDIAAKARAHGGDSLALRCLEARASLKLGRRAEARERALDLAKVTSATALEADTIGVLLVHVDLVSMALPFFRQATAAAPDNPAFAYNLATTRQFCGDIEGARETFAAMLARDPEQPRAWLGFVQVGGGGEGDIAMLGELLEASDDPVARLHYGHAAARLCERGGGDAAAMDWLERAKARHRDRIDYDRAGVDRLFMAAAAAINGAVEAARTTASAQEGPLFIVGMPRSGTTLIERVLGGHDVISSAGELSDFAFALRRRSEADGPLVLSPEVLGAESDLAAVGKAYLAQTAPLAAGCSHLIDKMPFNFFYVPHILEALPNARVLVVRRGDEDLAIANYRQLFATSFGYYDYHYDLGWTAHFVARAQALMDLLDKRLAGPRLRSMRYEAMTGDLEGEARGIVDWLGLDWSDDLLDFHRRKAAVTTASSVQVREPVHRRSVERWRRYGDVSDRLAAGMAREREAAAELF
ncbi:tetratricopeptide repeat-containing sulfotransferase family protein [Sphingomicrobium aestuariivivum]|uniref:tetratricopeptide repeat-containing sulfotransferase family protein n=1 Tax=Sphingomicrobium aestuariivivum TaxID=1582356 RepID=UPI001FD712B9|nr:sulfotransferase [Sphingomicrobium aestuariivivum]MCJ8189958.1 sulfotransferase [Sphingomicrobium aestuariivivum]